MKPDGHNESLESTSELDYQLSAVDSITPVELLNDSSPVKLPLPEQDRREIEIRLQRNRKYKFSMIELLACITVLCFLLALANWLPFEVYTVGMGCVAGCLMFGFFNSLVTPRYRNLLIWVLLPTYVVSVVWLILRR